MLKIRNSKAQMQMSVGTIVTIVLLMTVLILGLVLVRTIFKSATGAVENVDSAVQDEITKLFADENKKLVIYPASREISIDKTDTVPKGFAFSVRNNDIEDAEFSYVVSADDISRCGSSFREETANSYLIGGSGSFNLGKGNSLDQPRLVKIDVPESAPPCTLTYDLEVTKDGTSYSGANIFVTIA